MDPAVIATVRASFRKADKAGDGYLPEAQVATFFQSLGGLSAADVSSLLINAKRAPDGRVAYDPFLDWLMEGQAGETVSYGQAKLRLPTNTVDVLGTVRKADSLSRKCKIICTMGPSCWAVDKLVQLLDAGMNIARLNFSHGDHESHAATVARIREADALRPTKPLAILLDTKGPEIRTGFFKEGGKIKLTAGQDLKLVTDYNHKGDNTCIAVTYADLPKSVKVGGQILCADGSLVLKVKSVGHDFVVTEVQNTCSIGERKNCNLPGVKVNLPVLQEKDINDIQNFGIPNGVHFVAASFVQSRGDVQMIRDVLGERGAHIKIISKIENEEGLKNFDEIVEASDGIMVARGDLGMEIPPEKVFLAQKVMIAKCNLVGKPVVTATQMLESMTSAPRPTRAEAGDVANAVLDGTDCVMLSGETAGGDFPVEAVTIMRRIVEEAENALDYNSVYLKTSLDVLSGTHNLSQVEATCSTVVKTAHDVQSPLIICVTETGNAARQVAKYRPEAPIFAVSPSKSAVWQLACLRGVVPVLAPAGGSIDDVLKSCLERAEKEGLLRPGDVVVAVHGQNEANPFDKGHSNLMKMIEMPGVAPPAAVEEEVHSTYGQANLLLPRNMGDLQMFERTVDSFKRKCKIICTMGPSCWDVDMLVQLIDAGMNIARLNFSHGDHASHAATVGRIREADVLRPAKPIAILLDTKGPEIRTGFFAAGGKVDLVAGQDLKLVTDYTFKGDKTCFAVTYKELPKTVKVGGQILCADGSLVLKVKSVAGDHVVTTVMNSCSIGERKNCNLPGVKVELPVLQEKDINDIQNFGIPQGVHFVAASFVQSRADVEMIRQVLGERGAHIKIISKIENEEGLKNFDEICDASDGIMVARGDLGMEIPPEKVFLAQKVMIAKCNLMGKPVVTATQMLESMTSAPRPTRAEAGDVANAVLDGTDCVMLSGETAGGQFPVEAVTIMRRIVEEAETYLDYGALYTQTRSDILATQKRMSQVEAMASSAVKMSSDAGCRLIVCFTATGGTVRSIAKYRPEATILAATSSEAIARQLLCLRGVVSAIVELEGSAVDTIISKALAHAKAHGLASSGDTVVIASEQRDAAQGSMNSKLLKLVVVP